MSGDDFRETGMWNLAWRLLLFNKSNIMNNWTAVMVSGKQSKYKKKKGIENTELVLGTQTKVYYKTDSGVLTLWKQVGNGKKESQLK